MSAKNTPLFENRQSRAINTGQSSLSGRPMDVYVEPFDFPENEAKRSICDQHVEVDTCAEMMSEFWMLGCDFDKALEEGVVRVEFSCLGQSALRKRCRLKLTQYDIDGNVLNTGKLG